ncbi:DUF4245 family protein [Pseudokineococcus basanitobsidens]|uniref:DUF4245 family protein n=1 Tax=Pseudokineococcus basanitobsidens TaxID=1926649 RepID=A0ABU8RMD5_9ACTN
MRGLFCSRDRRRSPARAGVRATPGRASVAAPPGRRRGRGGGDDGSVSSPTPAPRPGRAGPGAPAEPPPGTCAAGPGVERPPQPPPRRPRPRQTARDMVISLAVIGAFLVPVLLLVPRPSQLEQPPVDVAGTAAGARERVDWPVPVPQVPDGWRPNAARLEQPGPDDVDTWSVGWVTPSDDYAGIRVASGATGRWLTATTRSGELEGTQDVDGEPWDVYSRSPQRRSDVPFRALVREEGGVTTAVVGTAEVPELLELAAAAQDPSASDPPA